MQKKEPARVKNYYQIMGVSPTCSIFEIENAYQKLATQWHPDKHQENRRLAEDKFHDIAEAYDVLSDRNSRANYDEILHKGYSMENAQQTFDKFFQEHGMIDEVEDEFFQKNFPQKKETHYKILGLNRDATQSDIKNAYRKLAIKHHPKVHPNNEQAHQKFLKINEAYNVLSDLERKRTYDNWLFGSMKPSKAHDIFENFWQTRPFEIQTEEQFFKPILKKKWSKNLDKLMHEEQWNSQWPNSSLKNRPGQINEQEQLVRTSTVYNKDSRGQSKKTITTRKKVVNGQVEQVTTEEYLFPNGQRSIVQTNNINGHLNSRRYELGPGQQLPKQLTN